MFEYADDADLDDRDKLVRFLDDVDDLLSRLAVRGEDVRGNEVVPREILPTVEPAWNAVQPDLEKAQNRVLASDDAELRAHGLTGAQLAFKLTAIEYVWRRYLESGAVQLLQRVLDVIDEVLKSILDAIGISGALDEFKGVLSKVLVAE